MKRFRSLAPYIALGPITGPLMAGIGRSLRAGRPVLAGLYALAVIETWAILPVIAARLLKHV